MNLFHSLGFFVLGLAMIVFPELAPTLANGMLHEVRKLWLEFMGVTISLIGSGSSAARLAAILPKAAWTRVAIRTPVRAGTNARPVFAPNGNRAPA